MILWRFYDGKPGHDRQSAGLARALAAAAPVDTYAFDVREHKISAWHYLSRRLSLGDQAPDPDLIIGAGRRCRWPLLAVRRARGGRAIYLMDPHIPTRCFDLLLIPRHDGPRENPRIIVTDGVLNDILSTPSRGKQGLLLIGGPSDHYDWDESSLRDQIETIVDTAPAKQWVVADSRRTPPDTVAALRRLSRDNVALLPFYRSAPDRLTDQLARSDIVWVTADSVSMIYEALTAGAAVGVLEIPAKRDGRITGMVRDLAARGMVTPYARWREGAEPRPGPPLAEAARCAEIILARLLDEAR